MVLEPCGNPATLPTATSLPCSSRTAASTSDGRTLTLATWYDFASRQPSTISLSVSSGRTSEWSIILARPS